MGFFDKLFGGSKNSGSVAKERLQVVLIQDRVKMPPGTMNKIRDEIIEVISKYVDIDTEGMEISLTKSARQSRLVADIPILRSRQNGRR